MDPRRLITIIVVGGLALTAVAIILFKIMQEAKRRNMENNYKLPSLEKEEEEEEETKFNVVFDDSKLSFKTDDEKELQKALTERSEVKGLSIDDMFEEVEENYKKKQKVYLPTLELEESIEESIEESVEETREERRAEIEEIIEGKDDGFSELLADLDLDGE